MSLEDLLAAIHGMTMVLIPGLTFVLIHCKNYYVTSIECTTVLRFIEQVINVIKNTIIINQHLTIHQASRDTYVLANKYQFIFIHLLAIIFEV